MHQQEQRKRLSCRSAGARVKTHFTRNNCLIENAIFLKEKKRFLPRSSMSTTVSGDISVSLCGNRKVREEEKSN